MSLTDLDNTPISTLPGTERYSVAVSGGTQYITTIRDPAGNVLGVASSILPSGVSASYAPTALATVGAGTLLAAAILGGVIIRSGSTSAFTDTTDTAALIQAAWSGGNTNSSIIFSVRNTTAFAETLAGGAGVTMSGQVIIPGGCTGTYLMVWTGTNTITVTTISVVNDVSLPASKLTALNATTGSLPAGAITGATKAVVISSNAVPGAQLVRTAAQMLADTPNGQVGMTWQFRIVNTGAGTLTLTADGGGTVTLAGTATVAQNTWSDFHAVINTSTTATITQIGQGTYS